MRDCSSKYDSSNSPNLGLLSELMNSGRVGDTPGQELMLQSPCYLITQQSVQS
jgi:hypothetical protein